MKHIVSRMLIYGGMPEDSIIMQFCDIFHKLEDEEQSRDELRTRVFAQIKRLLILATDYGFAKNLCHNYLTFLIITNEYPFSITCE